MQGERPGGLRRALSQRRAPRPAGASASGTNSRSRSRTTSGPSRTGSWSSGPRRGTWLVSDAEYGDFTLEFEIKLGELGNSGVALRAPMFGDPAFDGMEMQVADYRYNTSAKDSELTGGIYRAIAPSKQALQAHRVEPVPHRAQGRPSQGHPQRRADPGHRPVPLRPAGEAARRQRRPAGQGPPAPGPHRLPAPQPRPGPGADPQGPDQGRAGPGKVKNQQRVETIGDNSFPMRLRRGNEKIRVSVLVLLRSQGLRRRRCRDIDCSERRWMRSVDHVDRTAGQEGRHVGDHGLQQPPPGLGWSPRRCAA